MTVPDGYMMDSRGSLIPETKVKPEDKLEDELVQALVCKAQAISEQLREFKALAMAEVSGLRSLVATQYGATLGGAKGNLTLSSYDGQCEVKVAVSEHLSFGTQLDSAKALIDGCVLRWSEGANDNVRALIDHAFQVNKEGSVDTQRVLSLRRLQFDDEDWNSAMDAISDAIRVSGSKTYIRFYTRDPKTEALSSIVLDLANA